MLKLFEKHPLCNLFPAMPLADFEMLKMDIRHNGQVNPITTYDGEILDGWHRYQACIACGIEPVMVEYDGVDPLSYVLSQNKFRRHIPVGQMAAIIAAAQDWELARDTGGTGSNQHKKQEQCNVAPLLTSAERAEKSGASVRTQKQADVIAKKSPELIKQVAKGETTLAKAAEIITGKARLSAKPEPAPPADDSEIEQLRDSLEALREDHTRMEERLAVAAMDGTDEEKAAASELIAGLREENRMLKINLDAVTASRDGLMMERNEMIKQIKAQRRELDKLKK